MVDLCNIIHRNVAGVDNGYMLNNIEGSDHVNFVLWLFQLLEMYSPNPKVKEYNTWIDRKVRRDARKMNTLTLEQAREMGSHEFNLR